MDAGKFTIDVNAIGTEELIDRIKGMKQLVRAAESLCDDHESGFADVGKHVRKMRSALKRMQCKKPKE